MVFHFGLDFHVSLDKYVSCISGETDNLCSQKKYENIVLSFGYYHILFYTKCDYQIKNSQFQEFLVFWFLSFVFLTNWMSRFQESNSLIRNSQFLSFSYLGILEFAMNVGFSQNGFSANKIPSFQIPSFVIPTKTFLVLSFPVSCVNRFKNG